FNHPAYGKFHALGIMNCGSQKNFVLLLDSKSFKSLHNLGEKRVGDFGNDQSKNMASSGDQGTRLAVGVIPEFGNGLPNAFCQLCIDGRHLVDRARNGGGRYFGPSGYVTNVHGSPFSPSNPSI